MFIDNNGNPKWDSIVLWVLILVVVLTVAGVFFKYLDTASNAATAPARVMDRTVDTDNIINSYEDFRDTYQAFNARVDQIKEYDKRVNVKGLSQDESADLQTELSGQRQSCRDLVAHYNSAASQINHNIFKNPPVPGPVLPDTLDMEECNS